MLPVEEVRQIAREAAREAVREALFSADTQAMIQRIAGEAAAIAADLAAKQVLAANGVDVTDPREMQADMLHLRAWRKSTDSIKTRAIVAIITVLVTATFAAIWAGLYSMLHNRP